MDRGKNLNVLHPASPGSVNPEVREKMNEVSGTGNSPLTAMNATSANMGKMEEKKAKLPPTASNPLATDNGPSEEKFIMANHGI